MTVLFVFSGNSKYFKISPFTKAQGESLTQKSIKIIYFPLVGKGIINYCRNIFHLKKHLRKNKYDVIHAHYSLSGWVAVLASRKTPIVLSLMGDDAQGTFTSNKKIKFSSRFFILLSYFIQPFVKAIISKSTDLGKIVRNKKKSYIIPNGIELNKFIASQKDFRNELGLKREIKYVLFLGSPDDSNKNIALAKKAVTLLNKEDVKLINIYKAETDIVVKYLNSVDVFVLCSFGEGSANVVKEAMACNCPMVVTKAGDAEWVVGNTEGCFISNYDPSMFSQAISDALAFGEKFKKTKGRERIISLGLDSETIADKIIQVYKKVIPTINPL